MVSDFSSDCDCSNCLESARSESDCNPRSSNSDNNDSFYSRSKKKSKPSSGRQCCPSLGHRARPENDRREDTVSLSSEEGSYVESSQNNRCGLNPEGIARKIRPLRELTFEELVRGFGDNRMLPPNSMSMGHFRDQVVMKFRRALYNSGIWVAHVQGHRFEKHFSANYFKRNPGCRRRLVPWLKRELTAVYGDYSYTVNTLLNTILRHMTEHDLDSESFIHLLEPYLEQHTHHFLHEFISFVHSSYNMETYDQRAIYQYSASPWVKKESIALAPELHLPKDQALLASLHDTSSSENTHGQWNEQSLLSGLKQFPNGNSSLKRSEIPVVHHKTASKSHAWIKDTPEVDDHRGSISTNNMLLNWAIPEERDPGLPNCKQHVQERKTEENKLLAGHVLGKGETAAHTFSSPASSNQGKQRKYSLRERKVLSPDQHMNVKKDAEKNRCSDSSPKIFQRRLPRGRSLISYKSIKRNPSWSCVSENDLSSLRDGRKLRSFRIKRVNGRPLSQFAEAGSHASRRRRRVFRSRPRRSRSWCVRLTERSVSRESSRPSLRGRHRSTCRMQNIRCEISKEKGVHCYESNHQRACSATVQYGKLLSTAGKKPRCPSKSEDASRAGSHCNSPTCLQIEKQRSPSRQEMKKRTTFPRARKTRAVRDKNNKCRSPDMRTAEEVSDQAGDLNAISSSKDDEDEEDDDDDDYDDGGS
ncbi:E3 ubiquitin-protein ligase Topors-like [Saccopteryx leptura]|uniref:E3 ubiquitin-protein ligase Topors-like n=1 Tax=Saccopteryx leptura TaxID=249018 RepID=UPI00339C84B5